MSSPTLEDVHSEYALTRAAAGRFYAALIALIASFAAPYAVSQGFSIEELMGDAAPDNADTIFAIGTPVTAFLLAVYTFVARERQGKRFNSVADAHNATLIGMGGFL